MSQYRRGYEFERRVRKMYEAKGWNVYRSAGSHSPFDLILMKQEEIVGVQCQLSAYFPPAKRQQFENEVRENRIQGIYVWNEKGKIYEKRV